MELVVEVLQEAVHEILAEPVTFVIELVQFAILVVLIKLVAFGSKKRSGMLVNMINERRERVAASIGEAEAGEAALAEAQNRVAAIETSANAQAKALVRDAQKQAREQAAAIDAEAAIRAEAIKRAAREALEHEEAEILKDVRERLVNVVTISTQRVLEHGFSPAEQRAMVQKAIISGVDNLEAVVLG